MISDEEISKVRDATDLVSLIGSRVVLKQRRNEFWGCCPFHNEKTPSFKIDPVSQFYYCFGCGESGDAFTFTMKTENVDFPESVRLLAQRANIVLAEDAANPQRGRKARLLEVAAATVEFYLNQLLRVGGAINDQARSYLASRGLGGDVARRWKLGLAPGGGQLTRHLLGLGFTEQELMDTDVARKPAGASGERLYDRFYNRIIFPINDIQGRPIGFGGRVFLPGDESPAKYLNSAETALFKKGDNLYALDMARSAIVNAASAIVVEGYTDTIALHQAGFTNSVATLGTALTAQHLRLLARFTERVVLLFDGDEAGQRAADRAMDLISTAYTPNRSDRRRADVYVALLPGTLDPADFVSQSGPVALQAVLDEAVPLVRYSIDRSLARYDLSQPEQRSRAEQASLQLLQPLKGTALASDYLKYLADRFNLSAAAEAELGQRLAQLGSSRSLPQSGTGEGRAGASPTSQPDPRQAALERLTSLERELLFLYINQPELRSQLDPAFRSTNWVIDGHRDLAEELLRINQAAALSSPIETLSQLTASLPQATATLSASRLNEFSGLPPARLAEQLLFNMRETKLTAAISRINGERRLLKDDDPQAQELFGQLSQLQQELAELRKRFRGGGG